MTAGPLRRLLGLARRSTDPTDDAGLLARFAACGDADAFELLVWRHGGMVLGVARRILGDHHAAEDVFQATFLALARQAKSVRRDGCVAGWLHRVARRVALRAKIRGERRRGERRAVRPTCLEISEHVGLRPRRSPGNDPIVAAERSELNEILDEELDRLPERFRRAVVLCYLEGHSTAEAAERLGCPRGTVLSQLATAREKLRVRLLRRGVVPAILPPVMESPPVIHGGLTTATVRAAVANTAPPTVIDLCDGVIRAMILSKLKFATAAVLTCGMIGGGAGWMALTPGTPGQAVAGPQAKAEPLRPDAGQNAAGKQQRDDAKAIGMAAEEVGKYEENLTRLEKQWADQRIEARLKLADAEERYKSLEQKSFARVQAETQMNQREATILALRESAEERKRRGEVNNEAKAKLDDLRVEERQLEIVRAGYAKMQDELTMARQQARREMVAAEETLSFLDRHTAQRRRTAQADLENWQDRLSQLRGAGGPTDATDRKIKDVERKLDDVLRELTELRRELKK